MRLLYGRTTAKKKKHQPTPISFYVFSLFELFNVIVLFKLQCKRPDLTFVRYFTNSMQHFLVLCLLRSQTVML